MTPDHLNPDTLSAFVDGELQSANAQAVQQHLTECPRCALRVLSAMQLKAATARAGQRFAPSANTLSRLTAQLQPEKPTRVYSFRHLAFRPLALGVLAGALVLLAVFFTGWKQLRQTHALSDELLDQHLATLSSSASPQVLSTDRHTVKPWFQGKLPFSFNLPEPDTLPPDTTLKGANLTYLNDQPAAQLLFTIHKHEVSVFLTERTVVPLLPPESSYAGFTIHTAAAHDLLITAVSDVNPTELDSLLATLVQVQ